MMKKTRMANGNNKILCVEKKKRKRDEVNTDDELEHQVPSRRKKRKGDEENTDNK